MWDTCIFVSLILISTGVLITLVFYHLKTYQPLDPFEKRLVRLEKIESKLKQLKEMNLLPPDDTTFGMENDDDSDLFFYNVDDGEVYYKYRRSRFPLSYLLKCVIKKECYELKGPLIARFMVFTDRYEIYISHLEERVNLLFKNANVIHSC